MQETLLVIPDLYLPAGGELAWAVESPLAGLAQVARFGEREPLEAGWRAWLARWAAGDDRVASLAPAVLAAHFRPRPPTGRPCAYPAPGEATVWMATPVHLVASLTSLHLDRRSVLYLEESEQQALLQSFAQTFDGSGYRLAPLGEGGLLLFGPASAPVETREPARVMGENVADVLPRGPGAAALRQLGAEIEMWLHGHEVNAARERRGELTATSLWLWGGGAIDQPLPSGDVHGTNSRERIAFGSDAYLQGLCAHIGAKVRPLPVQFAEILSYSSARAAVLVVEAGRMLQANRNWTLPQAVAEIDRRFLAPAVRALRERALARVHVLANDRHWSLRARHRLRLWRRARPGLSGLL